MPLTDKSADVIIVGGGIVGLCTAYYLAAGFSASVVLLEKDLLAQASTGLCVGGIRQQFSHPSNIKLSQETLRLLQEFPEGQGAEIPFHRVGYLFLARSPETWREFRANVRVQVRHGVPVESLSPQEIQSRWPYLTISDLAGGTFCPQDGYIDPYGIAMQYAQACRQHKVKIYERTRVEEILIRSGRAAGVRTTGGELASPVVVNAAGPWGGEVGRMAGLNLPVMPYRRQVFATHPFDAFPQPVPMIIDQDALFYFRGEGPGLIMGMSDPDEPSGFHTHIDRDFLERLITVAVHRAPVLSQARILRGWAGLYAVTPDENPIIGEISEIPGLYCAVGFSGHGFQHAPAVGRILSDLIIQGKTEFDLRPFLPGRSRMAGSTGETRAV